ncbi:MAG: TRAP transporter large permease [Oscillospiraceae bacterium]|nr:TRAP transporter large permease [Oscillospiraceae bacterium]
MSIMLFALLLVFIFVGMPIGFAILSSSALFLQITELKPLVVVAQKLFLGLDSTTLLAIPLFTMMGYIMESCGLSKRLVDWVYAIFGRIHGSLGIVTVICCTIFAALSGSGPATVVAIGSLLIPAMVENGYPPRSAAGLTAMAGALGPVIPPSIVMIVYSTTMGTSITKMFMGGVLPGLLMATLMIVANQICARNWPLKTNDVRYSFKDIVTVTWKALPVLLLPVIILGGIYGGIITPTESATVGCVYSLVLALFYKKITVSSFYEILKKTVETSAYIAMLTGSAAVFGWILSTTQIPAKVAAVIVPLLGGSKLLYWIMLLIILVFIGCLMDALASIVMLAPILAPIGLQLGIDELHLGIVFCLTLVCGFVTPPFGGNLFAVVGLTKQPFGDVVKGVLPFLAASLIALLLVVLIPQIATFLPGLL